MKDLNGFLIINKNKGCTSHDCVKKIRNLLKIKKVGHTGTLDPEVTGILPIAIGNATKFIQYLPQEKTYEGIIKLGIRTDTDDIQGKVIAKGKLPVLNNQELEKYLDFFRGTIKQVPPNLSSVHINGERAYKKFFKNEKFELPPKEVRVNKLFLKKWNQHKGEIEFQINCSSGTYIRAIARDLGKLIKSEGCLLKLTRTEASGFDNQKVIKFENINELKTNLDNLLIPTIQALDHLPTFTINNSKELLYWSTGRKLLINKEDIIPNKNLNKDDPIKVIYDVHDLLGIGWFTENESTCIQPKLVLNAQ